MKNFLCWPKFNPRSLNYPEIPVLPNSFSAYKKIRQVIFKDQLPVSGVGWVGFSNGVEEGIEKRKISGKIPRVGHKDPMPYPGKLRK